MIMLSVEKRLLNIYGNLTIYNKVKTIVKDIEPDSKVSFGVFGDSILIIFISSKNSYYAIGEIDFKFKTIILPRYRERDYLFDVEQYLLHIAKIINYNVEYLHPLR